MEILENAIKRAGGVGALAVAIGAGGTNTVSNWRQRGRVPKGWLAVLEMKYGDQAQPESVTKPAPDSRVLQS